MALGKPQWLPRGAWVALAWSLGPGPVAAPTKPPRPAPCFLYRYTRVDPRIKCTRRKLIRAKGFWAYWLRKTFCQFVVSSCLWSCLLLSCLHLYLLALASLLLCPLVSYAGPPLGLFWASPGPRLGPILGLRKAISGLLAAPGALGPSWASPGLLLGSPLAGPGGPWAPLGVHSWRLLGLSWPAPGLLPASLGPSWRLLGPPLGRLGRLLAAESEFS